MDAFSVVISGAAGQGIETVAGFLAAVLKQSGYNVFVTREFMSRIRGGTNSVQLRISSKRVGAYSRHTDIAIVLEKGALKHLDKYGRIGDSTVVIGEGDVLDEDKDIKVHQTIAVPLTEKAKEVGRKIFLNTIAAGIIASLFDIDDTDVQEYLRSRFGTKGEDIIKKNIEAYNVGLEIGKQEFKNIEMTVNLNPSEDIKDDLLISGTDAIGLGAIAGGCNYIASYPMSPSTGVLTFLAQNAVDFGIVVDQTEDEISAINKGIGAWYSGARAMVTTSGGGFALMTEGLSLAGMTESPMVIHLAQRPGPATGLPTRTGQEDLKHVLGAAHGEFPRIVIAPGTPEDGFYLTQKAFNLADKFQVPVFILTDQFFVDSYYVSPKLDSSKVKVEKYIVKTDKDYKRYKLTKDGVSPRGIPGHGNGLIIADSDEHDEEGHITEDLHLRVEMVDKRRRKLDTIREEVEPPRLVGSEDYDFLVLAWGSNYYVVKEAIEAIENDRVALLHFSCVYPLHESTHDYLEKAKMIAVVENNATAQFAELVLIETGLKVKDDMKLLKYNGLPFEVEEVVSFLEENLK